MIPLRRFMDLDNSCLFSSIGYLISDEFSDITKLQYRQLLVQWLESNTSIDNLLDKSKSEYIKYIEDINTWGGAIELNIFSEMYQVQIATIDTNTNNIYIFGEDKRYSQIIYLIYTGNHYDPLVMESSENTNQDIKIFDSDDYQTLFDFKNYVNEL